MALLKPKANSKSKTISVRIPNELSADLDQIKRMADERGLTFDVADVVERALTQAARSARAELNTPPTTSTTSNPAA